jgi:O-antigen/teichoic acid export membrane protein
MAGYHKRTREENNIVLSNLIVFLAIANLGVISAGLIGLYLYFKLAQVMFPLLPYALFSLLTPYFTIFFAALTLNYKMQKRGWAYALVRMIYPILSIGIGLIFVIIMKWGAIGRMGAILIGEMIMGLYAFHTLFNKGFRFDSSIIKSALILGYPLIVSAILQFPINSIDKIFLERLGNIGDFALYNIGLKFASIVGMLAASVYQAFEPDFYRYIGNKEWKKLFIIIVVVFGSLSVINVLFGFVSKPIVGFLTSYRYGDAYVYADVAVWGGLLMHFTYFLSVFFLVYKKTNLLLVKSIIMAFLSIGVWWLSIEHWQFMGAAWAKIVINLITIIVMIIILLVSKRGSLPYNRDRQKRNMFNMLHFRAVKNTKQDWN